MNYIQNVIHASVLNSRATTDSAGDVTVSARDTSCIASFAGALAINVGRGGGLGAAIVANVLENEVQALVSASSLYATGGAFQQTAKETGVVVSVAIAGAGAKQRAIAASVGLDLFVNTVVADVIDSTVVASGAIALKSEDLEVSVALGGGIAISTQSNAVGAAVGFSLVLNTIRAQADGSTLTSTGSTVDIRAHVQEVLVNVTIGGAGGDKFTLGGSVAISVVKSTVDAKVVGGSTVNAAGDIGIRADDGTTNIVVAGGFAKSRTSGVGVSFSTIYEESTINALVDGSRVSSSAGKVALAAGIAPPGTPVNPSNIALGTSDIVLPEVNSDEVINVTIGGAKGGSGSAGGFGVSVNIIKNTIKAQVTNGAEVHAFADVTISAIDSSAIDAVAVGGALSSGGAAAGGAISANVIMNTIEAVIDASTVSSGGSVTVLAQSAEIIRALAIGASGGGSFSIAVTALGNVITNHVTAAIGGGSSVTAGAGVSVTAIDHAPSILPDWMLSEDAEAKLDESLEGTPIDLNASIFSIMVSVAGKGSVAISAALAGNVVTNTIAASISGSRVYAGGDIIVTAVSDSGIIALTVGVGATKTFAVQLSGFGNVIANSITAGIDASPNVSAGGLVALSAIDSSSINCVAISVAASGSAAISAIIGANVISDTISAGITDSNVTCGTTLEIDAETRATVYAFAVGVGASGCFALQALIAANVVVDKTTATITNSTVRAGGAVSLTARNISTIDALVIGVAASPAAAIEVPVVVNDIKNTTEATITGSTLTTGSSLALVSQSCNVIRAISIGVSASGTFAMTVAGLGNVITNKATSLITGSTITAAGGVSLSANDVAPSRIPEWTLLPGQKQQIDDRVGNSPFELDSNILAILVSIAGSGTVAISGVVAGNVIVNDISAQIKASEVNADGSVALDASADSGIISLIVGVGGSGVVAISATGFGNVISNTIAATIEAGCLVEADSFVDLDASDRSHISSGALSVAGSGGVAVSVIVGASVIVDTITAKISGSTVTAGGTLDLEAVTNSSLYSVAGGVAFAFGAGAIILAANVVTNTTEALIENSTATATDVTVGASDTAKIRSASGEVAIGVVGGLGAGVAYNLIANTIQARVLNSSVRALAGSVSVVAAASGTIETVAAGGSGGLAVGVAGTITIQTIGNTITAKIEDSTVWANDTVLVFGSWDGDISADGGTAALGGAVGIGGTIVQNTLANNVSALVNRSTVTANGIGAGKTIPCWSRAANGTGWEDDRLAETDETFFGVAVIADSDETINSAFATAAVGAVGLAVNKAVNLVTDTTEAGITDSHVIESPEAAAGVAVRAHQYTDVTNRGGVVGLTGLGVVGGFDTTIIGNNTRAFITDLDNQEGTSVNAGTAGVEVSAWSQEVVFSKTGSAGIGLSIGVAGSVSAIDIFGETTAMIGETTDTGGPTDVVSGGKVQVLATDISDVTTRAGALAVGLIAGVGGSIDFVTIARNTWAKMIGVHSDALGSTEVIAYNQARIDGSAGTGGGGGIAAVVGSAVVHLIEGSTEAAIAAGSRPSEINQAQGFPGTDVIVTATDYAKIIGNAGGYCVGLVAGYGASLNVDVIRRGVSSLVGDGTLVHAGGNVTVEALAEHFVRTDTIAFAASLFVGVAGSLSAVGLGGGINDDAHDEAEKANSINNLLKLSDGMPGLLRDDASDRAQAALKDCDLTIDSAISSEVTPVSVTATIGSAQVVAHGGITLKAERRLGALSDVGSTAVGGIAAGVGGSVGFIDVAGGTAATIGDGAGLTATTGAVDVEVLTDGYDTGQTDVFRIEPRTGEGSLGVGIGSAVAFWTFDLDSDLTVGSSSTIYAGTDVDLSATTHLGQVTMLGHGTTIGGIVGDGKVNVDVIGSITTQISVGAGAQLTCGNDLSAQAATTIDHIHAETDGGMGGLAGFGGQHTKVVVNPLNTLVDIGAGVVIVAGGTAVLRSETGFDFRAKTDQTTGGAITDNSVYSEASTVEMTRTSLAEGVSLTASSLTMEAISTEATADVDATCDTTGVFNSNTEATAVLDLEITADVSTALVTVRAPSIQLLAETGNLYADSQSAVAAGGVRGVVVTSATGDVVQTANINVRGGLHTTDLTVTADTFGPVNPHFYVVAGVKSTNAFGKITYVYESTFTQYTGILFNAGVYYGGQLSLFVDPQGQITGQGISAYVDGGTGNIIVEDVGYGGGARPMAMFFVYGGYGAANDGLLRGNPDFVSSGAATCTIVNESPLAIELGSIEAGAAQPELWSVYASLENSPYWTPQITQMSIDPRMLNVQSVGDILMRDIIDLPGLDVSLTSGGDIRRSDWVWATQGITALDVSLSAGGSIGTLSVTLADEPDGPALGDLQVQAGENIDLYVEPQVAGWFFISGLQAGGYANVSVGQSSYGGQSIETDVIVSGPLTVGGNLNFTVVDATADGSVRFDEAIAAGGDVLLDCGGTIYLWGDVDSPGGTVTLESADSVVMEPDAVITAHDVIVHALTACGGSTLGAIKVQLTGGTLTADGASVYVESVAGPLPITTLGASDGNVWVVARDTAGTNDSIILSSTSVIQAVGGFIMLTAGDALSVAPGGEIRTSESSIEINLDTQSLDPDPGVGAVFTYSGAVFSFGLNPVLHLNTGADNDTITIPFVSYDPQQMDINTGDGDDTLVLGGTATTSLWGQINLWAGEGNDSIVVDDSANTREAMRLTFDFTPRPSYGTDAFSMLFADPITSCVWYDGVDAITVRLGQSTNFNQVTFNATEPSVDSIDIDGNLGDDTFILNGSGATVPASLFLDGGTQGPDDYDKLTISDLTSTHPARLTSTQYFGYGRPITFANMEGLNLRADAS